ncbi:TRAP transporter small permease [Castellaniella sp.]|uniref:TRAP transporter small permease n=1 Tax=Castellaniella sp. TaxID=1955812 RepID=UPI0035619557
MQDPLEARPGTPASPGRRSALQQIGRWLYRRAENILAIMLGVMFVAFLLQVFFRYVMNWPSGWTNELSSVLWIWIVLWGAAFVVRENEEMRFDLILTSVGPRTRCGMFLITAVALIVLYGASFPAIFDYVTFMKIEKSAYLGIRFDWLYSIYLIFVIAILVRYLWLSWQVLHGKAPEAFDPNQAGDDA